MKKYSLISFLLIIVYALMMSACGDKNTHEGHEHDAHDTSWEQHEQENSAELDTHEDMADDHEDEHHHEEDQPDHAEDEAVIVLDKKAAEMIGLRTEKVKDRSLTGNVRLSGKIEANNDKLQHVYPRFSGLVEEVHANVGDSVKTGQILACVQNNETLAEYCLYSSLNGIVINKHIIVGEIVKEDSRIMTVADLSDVWVEFDVYAKDLGKVRKGQELSIRALGMDRKVKGIISFMSPVMDEEKRSVTARVVLPNLDGSWYPGMFVTGELEVLSGERGIAVPNEAVQIIEDRTAVFVPADHDHEYEPVFIEIGPSDASHTLVKTGLHQDDVVVTRGAFELKAKMVTSSLGGHAGHNH